MVSFDNLVASFLDYLMEEEELFVQLRKEKMSPPKSKEEDLVLEHVPKKLQKVSPTIKIVETIDEKTFAKKERYCANPIVFLYSGEKNTPFCNNLSFALSKYFFPVSSINIEEAISLDSILSSESIKLLLCFRSIVERNVHIKKHLTLIPSNNTYFLQKAPVYILQDDFFLTEPLKKKEIWNDLCKILQAMQK